MLYVWMLYVWMLFGTATEETVGSFPAANALRRGGLSSGGESAPLGPAAGLRGFPKQAEAMLS